MIITQTPLRISFAGGGTDIAGYYRRFGGEVISTAIDKFVYLIAKERYDNQIYLNYSIKEITSQIEDLEHDLIRSAMWKTNVKNGIEITTLADIPAHGSGLGSSSCVTVSALKALYAHQGISITIEDLAQQACEIEIEILGKPIGKQDQYIVAHGGLCHIRFNPDETVEVEKLEISEDTKWKINMNTLLFYTGVTRQADLVLVEQEKNIAKNLDALHKVKSLVHDMKTVLLSHEGNGPSSLNVFGEILHEGWKLKQTLAHKISNDSLNKTYETARKAGVIGGKLLGAGGGGFFLFYAPPERHNDIRLALHNLQEFPFHLERGGCKIIFNISQ